MASLQKNKKNFRTLKECIIMQVTSALASSAIWKNLAIFAIPLVTSKWHASPLSICQQTVSVKERWVNFYPKKKKKQLHILIFPPDSITFYLTFPKEQYTKCHKIHKAHLCYHPRSKSGWSSEPGGEKKCEEERHLRDLDLSSPIAV